MTLNELKIFLNLKVYSKESDDGYFLEVDI